MEINFTIFILPSKMKGKVISEGGLKVLNLEYKSNKKIYEKTFLFDFVG